MIDLVCCGAINWDINLFMDRLPRTGEEVPIREIERVSGGTAANVAVAAARILGQGKVSFLGSLGDDEIAERQLEILRHEGVDASGILRTLREESGQAYITIGSSGENEIHTYFGANLSLKPERLSDPERMGIIQEAKVAVIMDPPLETAERLAGICKDSGKEVIWDPGVYTELGLERLTSTLRSVDYFVLNHLEFENLLGTSEPREICTRLETIKGGIRAVIKHGSEGCSLCGDGGRTTIHIDSVPLAKLGMDVINTVGCGDAFIGAFASSKVCGLGDTEALQRGCAAGSFKATRRETRGGPTAMQLDDLLRRWQEL